ncbi:unnamed protein product [Linum trigynum]|uniref:Retrotransposon gag domain-containing protein n=1 Tax=Linum trigynum TaxID=586398 RepID=A0AAV2GJN7_9ROSI
MVGTAAERCTALEQAVEELQAAIAELRGGQQEADLTLPALGERFAGVDQGLHALGGRFDSMERAIRDLLKGKGLAYDGGSGEKETTAAKEGERRGSSASGDSGRRLDFGRSSGGEPKNGDGSRGADGGRSSGGGFLAKLARLEFPRFAGEEPGAWFPRVEQFFEYHEVLEEQRVSLASFHLEGEANQWWQWLKRTYKDAGESISWELFAQELWARFGPTEGESCDEALSRIRQTGSLRDYQRKFEKLANRCVGWTEQALVGTYMGGLKPEIADDIRMFRPQSLREAISLARMKSDQLQRPKQPSSRAASSPAPSSGAAGYGSGPTGARAATAAGLGPPRGAAGGKRLTWEEQQLRRAQGLCFNCDERFTIGHKCGTAKIMCLFEEEEAECQPWGQG